MSRESIKLLVGLGNPGQEYQATRHNVGFWFVDQVALHHNAVFKLEPKFHGQICRLTLQGQDLRLLKPSTYMNRSGQAVLAVARYFDIEPAEMLVAHDEIDLPAGTVRLKTGGGHAGHNGLRDIMSVGGSRDFHRLRIGVAHPGQGGDVVNHVLSRPSRDEVKAIEDAIDAAEKELPLIVGGDLQKAMTRLHSVQ